MPIDVNNTSLSVVQRQKILYTGISIKDHPLAVAPWSREKVAIFASSLQFVAIANVRMPIDVNNTSLAVVQRQKILYTGIST